MPGASITSIAENINIIDNYHPIIINYQTGEILTSLPEELIDDEEKAKSYSKTIHSISSSNTSTINDSAMDLENVSRQMTISINDIGSQIDKFKV